MSQSFVVEAARGEELRAAFSLMFQNLPAGEREASVDRALQLVTDGDLTPENLLVVRDGPELCAVLAHAVNPGGVGQVWFPQVKTGYPHMEIEDALLQTAIAGLEQKGIKFIQGMFNREESLEPAALLRAGFRYISSLLTLCYPLHPAEEKPNEEENSLFSLIYQPFSEADENLFQQTLLRTYEATLDFPELNGLRDVTDIIAAHKKHGTFHPQYWYLVWRAGLPVGVLLLVEMADLQEWELSYVGVVCDARGKGIGKAIVRHALRQAHQLNTKQLTVGVDTRNYLAWNLYTNLGFRPLEEHQVYLKVPTTATSGHLTEPEA